MPGWVCLILLSACMWHGTIGSHGIEERNLAGEEFLQFCESN